MLKDLRILLILCREELCRRTSQTYRTGFMDNYSCYWKLLRITAYCVKFIRKCKRRSSPPTIPILSVKDLQEAKYALVRCVQRESFAVEIKALANHRIIPAHSSLKLLNPFLDQLGILRVGGRLNLAGESTKAVHLELVGDLTTAAFLAALRRFISRRGLPAEIHSDNGLNFQGASNHLRELYDLLRDPTTTIEITHETSQRGIIWKFIPPRSPNFGGLWEAAVKSAKRSLIRVLGQRQLSFEDMTTILTQIEAVMNSRPLTPLSEDPSELDVLTPGHFLTGTSLLAIPDPDYTDVPTNRLQHYQQLQLLVQQHWKRWRREYISQLHNQKQRFPQATQLKVGQMVVVKEDGNAAIEWPLARITEIFPGPDGVVRVVKVRTPNGAVYKRQASRVCLLPFEKINALQSTHDDNPQRMANKCIN
ncbi:uncharacterized protein LOC129772873 [Toxorhynchites rutilus septentrionalis]|uniref:uncharacterized protein LOC129772873 n=1 Tax=Toxorhynchites rutilus septentrionalis TaxID=329112 RepID=UPI0024784AA4|nr:uncharacterized protein LOC129772873 [Toxorhynchites rutilus septentrionalis]